MTGRLARVHAWLLRALVPTLDASDAADAARALDDRLADARRRSRAAWLRAAGAEAAALARTAFVERRDLRRRRRAPAPPATPWAGGPPPLRPPARASIPAAFGQVWRDARHGARQLARSPLFTTVAVSSLAVGMAAAIAVFSVADVLLWQAPPHVQDPDTLVRLVYGDRDDGSVWSYLDFADTLKATPAVADAAAFGADAAVVARPGGTARETVAAKVSPGYFRVLGVRMALGRTFAESDLEADDAVVISRGFWRREFGGDLSALGQPIDLNGRTLRIVGVAPPGLRMLDAPVEPDVWSLVPRDEREHRGWHGLQVVARLAPGATLPALDTQLAETARELFTALSPEARRSWGTMPPIRAIAEREGRLPLDERAVVLAGLGGVLVVVLLLLAVAASNVANMMLTRASERQAEIGMRLALGATRRRVVAQLLVESGLVTGAAAALGLLAVYLVLRALAAAPLGFGLPAVIVIDLDWRAVLFAAGLALATGLFFGLAPALHATKADLVSAIKGVRPPARHGLRRLIVTAQVAASLILVVSSLLFVRSLAAALDTAVGFDPEGVVAVPIDLTQRHYAADAAARFYESWRRA